MERQDTYQLATDSFIVGENFFSYRYLGCHQVLKNGAKGFVFRVWAPNAISVNLVGDGVGWSTGIEMFAIQDTGIWEVYSSKTLVGACYKYKITDVHGMSKLKIDPFAFSFELRPKDASIVYPLPLKKWQDREWVEQPKNKYKDKPLAIYEVHAGSWRRNCMGDYLSFRELKKELIPYVKDHGYTHIEFLPLMEHPLDDSWGYQLTGYYALTRRYGAAVELMDFVEACHLEGIGVIMDWVPSHFCANDWSLAAFDGTAIYEYKDEDRRKNNQWGTFNFDLGSPEVHSFLISNALYWLDVFHFDGLRVDAVSSILYRDLGNQAWETNKDGVNQNDEGIDFLKKLTTAVHHHQPEALMIAEESSNWPKVTGTVSTGGLGFDYKWNMGWMNDILRFYQLPPNQRRHHFDLITFSFIYAHNEDYLLPLSHDEVVHGKKSLMHKMTGERQEQFAALRNLLAFMTTHPGKQLLFMGGEWGQFLEWRFYSELEWSDLADDLNNAMSVYTVALNQFYLAQPALWELDTSPTGVELVDANAKNDSVLSYIRRGKKSLDLLIVIANFIPEQRDNIVIGVPVKGDYQEVFNSELSQFGGTWTTHNPNRSSRKQNFQQFTYTIETTLPPLGVLILKPLRDN